MWRQFTTRLEKRRAQSLIESVNIWYQTSLSVSEICGEALHEVVVSEMDIGTLLDKADRKLFQYRNDATDARRAVKRHNEQLANQIARLTERIYELRNQTARFLIRAQGPSPFARSENEPGEMQDAYYVRALADIGYDARQFKSSLDDDIGAVWLELEKLLYQAEKSLKS